VVPDFTPPFPAYISGHSTFGAALFRTLANFYGTDNVHFTLTSDEMPGVVRSYDSFSQAARENGMSRIYLGIHWSFDNIEGQATGNSVADYVSAHELLPVTPKVKHPAHKTEPASMFSSVLIVENPLLTLQRML